MRLLLVLPLPLPPPVPALLLQVPLPLVAYSNTGPSIEVDPVKPTTCNLFPVNLLHVVFRRQIGVRQLKPSVLSPPSLLHPGSISNDGFVVVVVVVVVTVVVVVVSASLRT